MSFRLPLSGTKARELLGDMTELVKVLDPANAAKLPNLVQARSAAITIFNSGPTAPVRVNSVIVRYDTDERWLVSFGPRGGWRRIWNFGTGRD